MEANDNVNLLKDEYLLLQKTIEDYDSRALTIKAWSITFSASGLALAYTQGQAIILLLASFGAMVFWSIETVWKVHQHAFFPRIREIEAYFEAKEAATAPSPFRVLSSWNASMAAEGKLARWFARMRCSNVMLPHALIAAAGLPLFFFLPPSPP